MRYIFLILSVSQLLIGTTAKADPFSHDFSNPPLWHSPTRSTESNINAPVKVGLLVPLSGSQQKMGNSILNAAMMALYKSAKSEILIVPIDSGDSKETAQSATQEALEQGCDLIIGPVFSKQVMSVKNQIPKHINLISFSNDLSVAGDNIFIAGFSPHEQTNFIVQTLANRGFSKIIALLPDNTYGKEVGTVFKQAIMENLNEMATVYFYDPNGVSDEFLNTISNIIQENMPEAIYIPDAGRKTVSLISKLKYKGLNTQETLVIGSSDWNKPMFINDHGLKGALFPETKLPTSNAFTQEFQKQFAYTPDLLAEISYDLIVMASQLYQHQPNMCFEKGNITSKSGFSGLRGHFHFDPMGQIHRKYTLMEITGNKPRKAMEEESKESLIAEKYRNLFDDI